jgi:ribosomal protein S18 acetylase RimI-like enzyme
VSGDSESIELEGGARLRRAGPGDLAALVAIKRALPMPSAGAAEGGQTRSGGFLLGSEEATYRQLLAVARLWLLELDDAPVGFTVTLDDPTLRASPVWARRQTIAWDDFDPEAALERRVAYFDQLAVLPRVRSRYWGAALALRALAELIEDEGHELVLTTTVIEPIVNRAALPYLRRVGARRVGRLDEDYPGVGRVVSAIHVIEAPRYREHIGSLHAGGAPATRRVIDAGLELS